MIDGVRIKFCGLRSLVDAEYADKLGADFLGFILYPKSPRFVSLRDYAHLAPNLPEARKRVAVMVTPSVDELQAADDAGFDRFQIHFPGDTSPAVIAGWAEHVGWDRLWLAPKREPGSDYPSAWLDAAQTHLVDTFHADGFGGSGRTGDWGAFRELQQQHPERTWILAGGLSPANLGDALTRSGARFVDINSGVETAPGIKDHEKMKQVVLAIHRQREQAPSGDAS